MSLPRFDRLVAPFDRLRAARPAQAPGRWRLVGTLAGLAMAAASWFCAATPTEFATVWPGVLPWREIGGSPLAASVVLGAVLVMTYAWWALRDLDITVRWLVHTAALWFAPLLLSASLFSRDLYSYAAQGLMLHEGLDPYTQGVQDLQSPWALSVSQVWLDTAAPYGPLFMLLARAAAGVALGHQLVALLLLRLLAVAGVVVMAWAVPMIARRVGVDPVRATWLGVLTPLVGGHLVSGAHNDALMIAGMLAALALALGGRHLWAILAVALAMLVKVPAVVVVPFVAILWAVDDRGERVMTWGRIVLRSIVSGAATAVAFVALSLATGLGFAWLPALATPGKSVQWTSVSTAFGMAVGALGHLAGADVTDSAIAFFRGIALVVLAVALVGIWLHAVRHSHDRRVVTRSAGLALLAVVVLAPAFHGWYLLWALPVLAASTTDRRALTWLGSAAAVLAVAVLPGGYGLALTTTWVGVPLMVLATGVVAVRGAGRARRHRWRETLSLAEPGAGPGAGSGRSDADVLPDR